MFSPDSKVKEGELLWSPGSERTKNSNVTQFLTWLCENRNIVLKDYQELWRWSVDELEEFWGALWEYFRISSGEPYRRVLNGSTMEGARWFEGSTVNYTEHLLRYENRAAPGEIAVYHSSELRELQSVSWQELGGQVRKLAAALRDYGIEKGDRIVSYMPNLIETSIAMMSTTAIGAVWSSAAPEFGSKTVIDRFAQIQPKVLFATDGYRYAGKDFNREDEVKKIVAELPSLELVIWLPYLGAKNVALPAVQTILWEEMLAGADVVAPREFEYAHVEFDHPLWVLFSSGTTGLPKAIVHSHVGALVEHLKTTHFHLNLTPSDTMFFYSTTGWVMWNLLLSAMLMGGSVVLYDGAPTYPTVGKLWELAADAKATHFGASPTFVQIMEKAGLTPGSSYDLSSLKSVIVSGAPSTPENFAWFYEAVKKDLWVTSQSGGTEIASGFVGASPTLPVYAGEIQARMLGMDVHAWNDEGKEVIDVVGELVVTSPFPSMPICFWNDPEGVRYHESYFSVFPGVWHHGDFIKINERGGCYIYGRSDSTLNRHGVRIGTAEIYRVVEQLPEIADSLIVCVELPDGEYFMPLFLKLKPGETLSGELIRMINSELKKQCSPRHIPDHIFAVSDIPYTLTGKKMEIPVRKILAGVPLDKAASRDAMMNPASIDWFVTFAQERLANL